MKKITLLSLGLCVIIAFGSCTSKNNASERIEETPDPIESTIMDDSTNTKSVAPSGKMSALDAIKQEPKVKDAVITDANVLYVAVIDDGTSRDLYADYLCQVLSDYSSDIKSVKIVKFGSTNSPKKDNAYGILLGQSWCK